MFFRKISDFLFEATAHCRWTFSLQRQFIIIHRPFTLQRLLPFGIVSSSFLSFNKSTSVWVHIFEPFEKSLKSEFIYENMKSNFWSKITLSLTFPEVSHHKLSQTFFYPYICDFSPNFQEILVGISSLLLNYRLFYPQVTEWQECSLSCSLQKFKNSKIKNSKIKNSLIQKSKIQKSKDVECSN